MEFQSLFRVEEITEESLSRIRSWKALLLRAKEEGTDGDTLDIIQTARNDILQTCQDIQQCIQDPRDFLEHLELNYQHLACFNWILSFDILSHVPTGGESAAYDAIAAAANVPAYQLKRVCRLLTTNGVLAEPFPGHLAHSHLSLQLSANKAYLNWARFMTQYMAPVAASFADATARWGETSKKNQTAYNLAFNTDHGFFETLRRCEGMNAAFTGYMRGLDESRGLALDHLLTGYDWKGLGEAHIVDVGGSSGQASFFLASHLHQLSFTVEDVPDLVNSFNRVVSCTDCNVASRVSYAAHDFFQPQPVHIARTAEIYLLRKVLHDWAFDDARRILQHLAESLRSNARIIVMDSILPESDGVPKMYQSKIRLRDLTMAQFFNSKERELSEWLDLFNSTIPKLQMISLNQPSGSYMAVMEIGKE